MKTSRPKFKAEYLYGLVYKTLNEKLLGKGNSKCKISTPDCVLSALIMFALKTPSLLQFEENLKSEKDKILLENLKKSLGLKKIPSDTQMRVRLDGQNLDVIRSSIRALLSTLKREKKFEEMSVGKGFEFDLDHNKPVYLVAIDGVQFYESKKIHCAECCESVHEKKNGSKEISYHHSMLTAVIVNPNSQGVLPLDFEPITKQDGAIKNDCERNAAKRLLKRIYETHPTHSFVFLGDSLYSNGPFIEELKQYGYHFLLTAKESDHKYMNDYFWAGEGEDIQEQTTTFKKGKNVGIKHYRSMENVPLNEKKYDIKVNVLYTKEQVTVPVFNKLPDRIHAARENLKFFLKKNKTFIDENEKNSEQSEQANNTAEKEKPRSFQDAINFCLSILSDSTGGKLKKKMKVTVEENDQDLVSEFLEKSLQPWSPHLKEAHEKEGFPLILTGNQKNFKHEEQVCYEAMWCTDLNFSSKLAKKCQTLTQSTSAENTAQNTVTIDQFTAKAQILMEALGRTRWHIENQTFNTLKTKGYHFEHNYGHGNKGLSNFLAGLMLLAFLIDQILELFNKEFQDALNKIGAKTAFWDRIRHIFLTFVVETWSDIYDGILDPPRYRYKAASAPPKLPAAS